MKEVIYKYSIRPEFGVHEINIPSKAKVLSAQVQRTHRMGLPDICLWALVNPENDMEIRKVELIGTGTYIHDSQRFFALNDFVGTCQIMGGLVFHIFISK